jgi:hypothetical protein
MIPKSGYRFSDKIMRKLRFKENQSEGCRRTETAIGPGLPISPPLPMIVTSSREPFCFVA